MTTPEIPNGTTEDHQEAASISTAGLTVPSAQTGNAETTPGVQQQAPAIPQVAAPAVPPLESQPAPQTQQTQQAPQPQQSTPAPALTYEQLSEKMLNDMVARLQQMGFVPPQAPAAQSSAAAADTEEDRWKIGNLPIGGTNHGISHVGRSVTDHTSPTWNSRRSTVEKKHSTTIGIP